MSTRLFTQRLTSMAANARNNTHLTRVGEKTAQVRAPSALDTSVRNQP